MSSPPFRFQHEQIWAASRFEEVHGQEATEFKLAPFWMSLLQMNEEVVAILKEVESGKEIERVDLSGRGLRIFPDAFGRLKSIIVLNLPNNQLQCLLECKRLSRSQSSWKKGRSFRTSFQEEAWKRYNRRMQEEYEEEMERVERIRRMQSVFNRERNKFKKSYQSWQEYGPGACHQHSQRNDWYWQEDNNTSFRDYGSNFRDTPRTSSSGTLLSHHYSVLGLDRLRTTPYTEKEIKVFKDRNVVLQLVRRAEKAGFKAIALTVDTPRLGRREADIKNSCPREVSHVNFLHKGK